MSNYNNLKTTIDANIKQNGNQEITGPILNSVLNQMVNILGTGYQFAGIATLATEPGTPDAKVFYIANGKGTYTNFGSLEVTEDDVVVLYWDSAWHKVATGIASQAKLSELESKVDGIVGKKPSDIYLDVAISKAWTLTQIEPSIKSGSVIKGILFNGEASPYAVWCTSEAGTSIEIAPDSFPFTVTTADLVQMQAAYEGRFSFIIEGEEIEGGLQKLEKRLDATEKNVSSNTGKISHLEEEIVNKFDSAKDYTDTLIFGGSIDSEFKFIRKGFAISIEDGKEYNLYSNAYNITDYIELKKCSSIDCTFATFTAKSIYGAAFYDENKDYIEGIEYNISLDYGVEIRNIPVPKLAAFIRVTYWDSSYSAYKDFSCKLKYSDLRKEDNIPTFEPKSVAGFVTPDKVFNIIGWNHHMNHDSLEPYTDKMVNYVKYSGANFVRSTIIKKSDNGEIFIPELYEWAKSGVEILTSCDGFSPGQNIQLLKDRAKLILENCNGIKELEVGGNKFRMNVKYIYAMNEPHGGYNKGDTATIKRHFEVYKEFYIYVHSLRSDVVVLAGGLPIGSDYLIDLCNYKDDDGKHFWDYIDVFDFHLYPVYPKDFANSCKALREFMLSLYDYKNFSNFIDVPVWCTEYGFISFTRGVKREMSYLATSCILGASYGVQKMLVFRLCGVEEFNKKLIFAQSEEFFGLVHKSLDNSYISFMRNEGDASISLDNGNEFEKMYLNGVDYPYISMNSILLNRVTTNGLVVKGNGFTLDSVEVVNIATNESCVVYSYSHTFDGNSSVVLQSNLFKNINIGGSVRNISNGDYIKFNISNVTNTSGVWQGDRISKSFYAIKNLSRLLANGSTIPYVDKVKDAYIASWDKPNGKKVVAIWLDSTDEGSEDSVLRISVSFKKCDSVFTTIGDVITISSGDTIDLGICPIYFDGVENFDVVGL